MYHRLLQTPWRFCPKSMQSRSNIMGGFACGFLFLFALCTFGDAGLAQDQIGVFFDENAGSSQINTTELNQEVSAYVTILLPSHEEGLLAIEFGVDVVGSAGTIIEPYGGCAIGTVLPSIFVGCESPLFGCPYQIFHPGGNRPIEGILECRPSQSISSLFRPTRRAGILDREKW